MGLQAKNLISPSVVGRDLDDREKIFAESINRTIQDPHPQIRQALIVHLQRGAYIINSIDPPKRAIIEKLFQLSQKINLLIAEYLGYKASVHSPLSFIIGQASHPIAIFKPADEVRGASNCRARAARENPVAKHGILPELEIPNEIIASSLFPLKQPVVQMSIRGPFFYQVEPDLIQFSL